MSFTFYKQLFYTTTHIDSFTAESPNSMAVADYNYFFDRKENTTYAPGTLHLDFGETVTMDALIFDQTYIRYITARYSSRPIGTQASFGFMKYYVGDDDTIYTNATFDLAGFTFTSTFIKISYSDTTTATKPSHNYRISMTNPPSTRSINKNLILLNKTFELSCNPDSSGYRPVIESKEFIHKIGNAGIRKGKLNNVGRFDIKLNYISIADYNSLKSLYEQNESFFFVPFPTTTTDWESLYYKVNWTGDFEFEKFQDSYKGLGYKGKIELAEVPK